MITMEEIKEDIRTGKCTHIYVSTMNLWWTHNRDDAEKATLVGKNVLGVRYENMLKDPTISPELSRKLIDLSARLKNDHEPVFLDLDGSPVNLIDYPLAFVTMAIRNSDKYGKYGIGSFMKVHHQNCEGLTFKNWDEVTIFLNNKK